GRRSARHAMLPRAGFGNDALGTEALRQQRLTNGVVDLVRAGMSQILPFEPDLGPPTFAQCRRMGESRGPARPRLQFVIELRLKFSVVQEELDARLQPVERRHQGLRNVAAAESAVTAARIGI